MFTLTRQEQLLIVFILSALFVGRVVQHWRHRLQPLPVSTETAHSVDPATDAGPP